MLTKNDRCRNSDRFPQNSLISRSCKTNVCAQRWTELSVDPEGRRADGWPSICMANCLWPRISIPEPNRKQSTTMKTMGKKSVENPPLEYFAQILRASMRPSRFSFCHRMRSSSSGMWQLMTEGGMENICSEPNRF